MEPVTGKSKGYLFYPATFGALTILTLIAVGLTRVRLPAVAAISMILLIACLQALIVLFYNMHLKFHEKILAAFTGVIFLLIFLTIGVTLLDYITK